MSQAEYIEIEIYALPTLKVDLPINTSAPEQKPEFVIALQSARGQLGEIRIWRIGNSVSQAEKRLLQTFASQGALALEHAQLAQVESRAKLLEDSDQLKSAILSSVSHELRTPLATIKASISSLRSGEVNWESSARTDLLAAVDDETDRLNILVGNLLDMSRIEAGALKPQRQWNLLAEIIDGVLARMQHLTEQHRIETDVPDDLPLLPVDYVQMEQVFTNLISNSVKYAPLGSLIRISVRVRDEEAVLVKVSNQGPQVPPEHIERIFDKFYRVTAADRVTGTGLGLS
ncbi:MAG: hypothetical protein HYR93_02755, partial [Chloroflexi bacterium]|nr:hypothetical protein [Chloroflexota bacterium]